MRSGSVNNVFDRIYYQTTGIPTGGNCYGEPRGFVLRINGRYTVRTGRFATANMPTHPTADFKE